MPASKAYELGPVLRSTWVYLGPDMDESAECLPAKGIGGMRCFGENTLSGGSRLGTPLYSGVPNPASSRNPLFYEWFGESESERNRARERQSTEETERSEE